MKKVLIADDDFLVRTYLKQLIDWEQQGFSIVGEAKNGQDALELIKNTAPDVVITDICMPIMDGIELIRRLKSENSSCHILVLSSHDDFNYVREALKLGIDDYLLKDNLTPKHILDFLQEHIKETGGDRLNTVTDDELLEIGKEKLRADFLTNFTAGAFSAENIAAASSKAGINPSFSMAAGILIELRGYRGRKVNLNETLKELGASTVQRFLPSARTVVFKLADFASLWGIFVFLDAASKASVNKAVLEISAHLSRKVRSYLDLAMIAGFTNLAPNLASFMQEWTKLVRLNEGFFYLPQGTYSIAKIPIVNDNIDSIKENIINFSDCCRENLLSSRARQELAAKLKLTAAEIAELKNADDIEELKELAESWLKAKDARKNIHPSIAQALTLIETHYKEPLTQPDIAAAVHLNPAYFSTLFKKNVGKGFREFLAERRIDAVKEQLLSSTERIKDIATAIGFEDYPYFCRLFKQLTGLSPQEYRLNSLK